MLKFNMGCGRSQRQGWVNVDAWAGCEPDAVWDLERTPWPWPDSCADHILFHHSLEHLGRDPQVFLEIIRQVYRIAAHDALVEIVVPHPRSDDFLDDPTHVRPITWRMMGLFDRRLNETWAAQGASNTPLAFICDVDFRREGQALRLHSRYQAMLQEGAITSDDLPRLAEERFNVISEVTIRMRAHKPHPAT